MTDLELVAYLTAAVGVQGAISALWYDRVRRLEVPDGE